MGHGSSTPLRLPDYHGRSFTFSRFRFSAMGVAPPSDAAILFGMFYGLERTRFGAMIRAAVDDRRVALGVGINVNPSFTLTFAIGSGLAGLGGALGINHRSRSDFPSISRFLPDRRLGRRARLG